MIRNDLLDFLGIRIFILLIRQVAFKIFELKVLRFSKSFQNFSALQLARLSCFFAVC